ncbi:hypothetical protein AKJ18_21805 [Vibrio xuii]|nr:hypothetical protein AKJ18_21805 [Vibrio xuii]
MNKYFKILLLVACPLLTLIAGCNSEGAFSSQPQPQPQPPVNGTAIEVSVTPSKFSVLEGHTQQLVAMAKYDDGSESEVSDSVTWEIVGDPTIADVSASGLLTGNVKGDTELIASKDGITSDAVNVTVCDLVGPCIDIFDTGIGKLFTNSPSEAYLDSIGGSDTSGIFTENGSFGPSGDFYLFDWSNANALCDTYNIHSLGGRTNWRLATKDELRNELYDASDNMFTARGWPANVNYWSETLDVSTYYIVSLNNGIVASDNPSNMHYASCVSNP